MHCSHCHQPWTEGSSFCTTCGAPHPSITAPPAAGFAQSSGPHAPLAEPGPVQPGSMPQLSSSSGQRQGPSLLRRVGFPVAIGVTGLLLGLVLGFVAGGGRSIEDIRTNAMVRAAEGTWECEGEDDFGDDFEATVEIASAGVFRLDLDYEFGDAEYTGIWAIDRGELTTTFEFAEASFDGVPDQLQDTTLDGGFDRGDDQDIDVEVISSTEVEFSSDSVDLTCEKVDSEPPDIPRGLAED